MSFDISLLGFKNKEVLEISRDIIKTAFESAITSEDGDRWSYIFPDGGYGTISTHEYGFSINRPGGSDLYDAIYEIMRQTPTALFWDAGVVIANQSLEPDLPLDMLAALGAPTIVHSGADIIQAIQNS